MLITILWYLLCTLAGLTVSLDEDNFSLLMGWWTLAIFVHLFVLVLGGS